MSKRNSSGVGTSANKTDISRHCLLATHMCSALTMPCLIWFVGFLPSPYPFTPLGSLPRYIYSQNLSLVMEGLIGCAISTDAECSDSRREAMLSLSKLCITLGVQKDGIGQAEIERLMSVLIGGMEDYTQTPKKGDAGANVRAACMTAFKVRYYKNCGSLKEKQFTWRMMCIQSETECHGQKCYWRGSQTSLIKGFMIIGQC